MPASDRQLAANRANALKSTGPRTPEGKEVSRANAYKHGLAGAGVIVPDDEAGRVAARVAWVQESMAPEADPVSLILAQQVAFLSIRQERCFDHIEAVAEERARHAEADHDDARRSAAELLLGFIGDEPITYRRRLLATPEGTDLLIATLEDLRRDAAPGRSLRWGDYQGYKFDQYCGRRPGTVPVSRAAALTDLIERGDVALLEPGEVAALDPDGRERAAWALRELTKLIDDELASLRAHRAGLDPARFDASRAEAGRRARGGADKELVRLQRYEAATHRALRLAVQDAHAHRVMLKLAEPAALIAAKRAAADARPGPAHVPAPPTAPASPPRLAGLASFRAEALADLRPGDASRITVGKPPRIAPRPAVEPPDPPRYTP